MPNYIFRISSANKKAFTLIEIMLTVSIISILTAAIIPTVGNFADANIAAQAAQNIAADIENAKFKALSGVYDGDPTSIFTAWGFSCAGPTSYILSSYDNSTFSNRGTVQRTVTVNGGATISCTASTIVFQRLTGQVKSGGGSQITVTKGTKSININISNNGAISLVKIP